MERGTIRGAPAAGRRGFSLIELIVVLVIMAILGSTIVPQFAGTQEDVILRASGREIVAALTLSYSLAVSRQTPCRLLLDAARGRWRIEAPAAAPAGDGSDTWPARGGSGEFALVRDVPETEGTIDHRIAVQVRERREEDRPRRDAGRSDASPEGILFRPDGTAEPKEVVLRDRAGFGIAVRVNPATSRVRAMAIEREEPR